MTRTRAATEADASLGVDAPEEARLLTRAELDAAEDIEYRVVHIPEWGGSIRLRALTGSDRDSYDAESWRLSQAGAGPIADFRVRRVARAIVDADGKRLYSDKDVAALGKRSGAVLDRLDDIVSEMSGLTDASKASAAEALKADPSAEAGSASA